MSNWYEQVTPETKLTQGDLVFDCPVPKWVSEPILLEQGDESEILKASLDFISADLIVLTQACDLEQGHVSNVTLCPHIALAEFKAYWKESEESKGQNPTTKNWERKCTNLNNGYIWNQTLLNKCDMDGAKMDFRVVDFYEVFTLPKSFIEALIEKRNVKRLRLLPPYREHLSQAFSRFYMRVGLPTTIDPSDL